VCTLNEPCVVKYIIGISVVGLDSDDADDDADDAVDDADDDADDNNE
jgi:hypothetical protein